MRHLALATHFDFFRQAQKAYGKQLDPVCKQWGLTRNELDVLLYLYNNPEHDRAADIVTRRGIAKSHVSLSVSTLEYKELLRREYSATDRRTAHLKLTEQGVAIAALGREQQRDYFEQLYTGVTEEELEVWNRIKEKICQNIEHINNLEENP